MKLKELAEKYGEYEIYTDSPKHIENAFKNLDTTNDGVLCLYAKKPKPKTVWELEEGDMHNLVDFAGRVQDEDIAWMDDDFDKNARAVGNVFLTREEALRDVERRKVETLLLKHGGRRWFKADIENWIIRYNYATGSFECGYTKCTQHQSCIYFDTKEQAMEAVNEIGKERIKQALFEVR